MRANGRGCLSRHASRAGQGAPLRFELSRRHIAGIPNVVDTPNVAGNPSIVDIPNVAGIPESRASLLPEHRNETSWLQL